MQDCKGSTTRTLLNGIASEKQQASLCWPQSPTLCAAMKERIDDRPEVILVCVHGPSEYLPALPLNVAPGAARWRKQRTRDTMCTLRRIVNGESQLLVCNAVKRLEFRRQGECCESFDVH